MTELARKIAASINGTNGTSVRLKCDTPEQFYEHWLETQMKRNRDDYVDYAEKYKDEIMHEIYQLYSKRPNKVVKQNAQQTALIKQRKIIQKFIIDNKHNTKLMDWANRAATIKNGKKRRTDIIKL